MALAGWLCFSFVTVHGVERAIGLPTALRKWLHTAGHLGLSPSEPFITITWLPYRAEDPRDKEKKNRQDKRINLVNGRPQVCCWAHQPTPAHFGSQTLDTGWLGKSWLASESRILTHSTPCLTATSQRGRRGRIILQRRISLYNSFIICNKV